MVIVEVQPGCVGGPDALIHAVLADERLTARGTGVDEDPTPPGFARR